MLAIAHGGLVLARPSATGRRAKKCTCGKTKTPPNCDGSHARFVETLQKRQLAPMKLGVSADDGKKEAAEDE